VSARDVIETLAIMLGTGLASELLANVLRVPRMILLVGAGALLGPYVLDAVDLPLDAVGIELLLTLGVSIILFHGGLGLSVGILERAAVGLGLLAIPGVILTAVVTGVVAAAAFGLPFESGLLIGAVLAPTDPAILIPLFERLRMRPKVVQTVIAESAFNDVTGAVLSLAVAAYVLEGEGSLVTGPLTEFAKDLGISTAIGVGFGFALAVALSTRRVGLLRETPAIAALTIVAAGFFSIDLVGGSGYLGAFLAGLIVANSDRIGLPRPPARALELESFAAIASDIVVIFVFITLGANLPFDSFPEYAGPAIATLAALIFVARPLTVLGSLLPDRRGQWTRQEIAFVSWTRETGVVPAAVASLLVAEGIQIGDELVTTVALAIIVTLLLQSTTKSWLARKLGLLEFPLQRLS
jgi:cell volume regulation protein A